MKGPEWESWRVESGPAFKQALRDRVENFRPSIQVVQPQPMEQHVDESTAVEQIETKASVLQKSLRSININGSVRIHELTADASLIGVVTMICPEKMDGYM